MFLIFFFILGSLWGSFSNVCIYRLPKNESVVFDRSYCPGCKKKIKWFDNIPLISFIFLKAKCRCGDFKISSQYFIVELLTASIFAFIYFIYGFSVTTLLFLILTVFFVIIFFIDLKHYIIPNELTFPLMFIGFVKSFDPNLNQDLFPNYINSLIGGLAGYLIIWSIITFYNSVSKLNRKHNFFKNIFRQKEGMGLGDAKLLSAMGFWFGWASIPIVIFFSSIIALSTVLPSLINKTRKLSSEIPYGPFLIIGCVIFITFGNFIKFAIFNL